MIGYNIDVLRLTACLVVNPVKVNNFLQQTACLVVNPIKVNNFASSLIS